MSKVSKLFKGTSGSSSSKSSSSSSSSSSGSKAKHRSRSGAAPSPQEAIHRLRETEAMLSKKQEYLEMKIEQELIIAKKNGTKNKRAALQALKRKKRFEQQLTQIDGTLSTIEFQREALENANTNTEVLKNMSYAAKAIKGVHQNIDLDNIDSLMADITEQQEIAREISDAISQPFGSEFDEDELLAELAELEQEELEESMKNMGKLPSVPSTRLPSVPSTRLPSVPSTRLPSVPSTRLPSVPSTRLPSVPSTRPSTRPSQRTTSRKRGEDEDDMKMLAAWAS